MIINRYNVTRRSLINVSNRRWLRCFLRRLCWVIAAYDKLRRVCTCMWWLCRGFVHCCSLQNSLPTWKLLLRVGEVMHMQDTKHAIFLIMNWESEALVFCIHMDSRVLQNVQSGSGAHPLTYSIYTEVHSQEQSGRGMRLTTHFHLCPHQECVDLYLCSPIPLPGMDRETIMFEICALVGYYAAWRGSSVPTFRYKRSVSSSRVKKSKEAS
jgi:hypothetical protein